MFGGESFGPDTVLAPRNYSYFFLKNANNHAAVMRKRTDVRAVNPEVGVCGAGTSLQRFVF